MEEKKQKKNSTFRDSFRLDRRFGMVLVWELCLVVAIVLGFIAWAMAMNTLTPLIDDVVGPLTLTGKTTFEQQFLMGSAMPAAQKIKNMSILYTSLALIYLLLVASFFKAKTYFTINRKSLTKLLYAKFLGLFALWNVILIFVAFLLQLFIHKFLYFKVSYSAGARASIIIIGLVYLQVAIYLTSLIFNIFTSNGDVWDSFSELFRTAFLKVHKFLRPILAVFFIFIVLNILLFVSRIAGPFTPFIATTWIILFTVWVKIYYSGALDRVQARKQSRTEIKTKAHIHHKSKTPNKVLKKVKTVKKKIVKKRSSHSPSGSSHSHSKK